MELKTNRSTNVLLYVVLTALLFLSIGGVSKGEELGLLLNAPINSELASAWIMTLQRAYDSFLILMAEISKSALTMSSSTIVDFEVAAKICFSLVKGKILNTVEEFKITARAVSSALAKAVVFGIRAVGELASKEERGMAQKLATTMDLMQNALELTYNLIPLL